ncbi:hypothetical protein D3C87_710610 [compost metagenome]
MLGGATTALRWKSSPSSCAGSKWVLSSTVSGNTVGNGQWLSSAVQQAGRAGVRFMAGILPVSRDKVEMIVPTRSVGTIRCGGVS